MLAVGTDEYAVDYRNSRPIDSRILAPYLLILRGERLKVMAGRDEKTQDTSDRDSVEIVGCVVAVDVRRGVFEVQTDDDRNIPVSFTEEQESEVIGALMEYRNMCLQVKGRGEFDLQGVLQRITEVGYLCLIPAREPELKTPGTPIEEMIAEIMKDVPEEVLDQLPRDLSHRHDFYLYGEDK